MEGQHEISVFSKTLFKIGKQSNKLKDFYDEFSEFVSLINKDPNLTKFLRSPKVHSAEKKSFLDKVFGKVLSKEFLGFITVVLAKRCQHLLEKIFHHFEVLVDQVENIARGEVLSAQKLDQKTLDEIAVILGKRTGKTIILSPILDEKILGGLILQFDGKRIDLSVSHRLDQIKDNILNVKVTGAIS